jgi:hypothetical protein
LPQYGVHDMTTDINTKFRQHPASFLWEWRSHKKI